MDNKTNEILQKNVALLSKLTEQEVNMMPAIEAAAFRGTGETDCGTGEEHHLP